jgi:glycosyltransferase involved in cell wall biosynthesis
MKFSLILATYGEKERIRTFLDSLASQTYKDFELIVVDQNEESHVKELCTSYEDLFCIKYLPSEIRGLSHARNLGLKLVEGSIIAFPDDDCEYPPDLLGKVKSFFDKYPQYDILTGVLLDKGLKRRGRGFASSSRPITENNIFATGSSVTIFIKHKDSLPRFDEQFGIGANFGSTEETDYLIRLLGRGYKGFYHTNIWIYHPDRTVDWNERDLDKKYHYSLGVGAFFKKHLLFRGRWRLSKSFLWLVIIGPVGGFLYALVKRDRLKGQKYKNNLRGRIKGLILYDRSYYEMSKQFE